MTTSILLNGKTLTAAQKDLIKFNGAKKEGWIEDHSFYFQADGKALSSDANEYYPVYKSTRNDKNPLDNNLTDRDIRVLSFYKSGKELNGFEGVHDNLCKNGYLNDDLELTEKAKRYIKNNDIPDYEPKKVND